MTAIDGTFEKAGSDPVQTGSLLSLLPSILLHATVAVVIRLGLFEDEPIQPPVTFISLAPAVAPASEQSELPIPVVPAPEPDVEPDPLPLPDTGMFLPQAEAPETPEPAVDFMPPELPELESPPFDPKASRQPEPEPEDAVAIEQKKAAEKPKEPEKKPKEKEKRKEKSKDEKKKEKPKKKETKKAASTPAPEKKTAPAPVVAQAAPAKPAPPASAKPANTQNAAVDAAPTMVTNPAQAGECPIPEYPRRAVKRQLEGIAVVRFTIGTDGKASDVVVVKSTGHEILDDFAQEVVTACKYVPQMRGNRAVPALAERAVPFVLN